MRKHLAILMALALSTAAAPALAGSQPVRVVDDAKGDVDVQHLVDAGLVDQAASSQADAEAVGDVIEASVHTETQKAFQMTVRLADIPDQDESSAPVMEVWTHWTINENDVVYHTRAVLLSPQPGAPLQANHELYKGEAKIDTMSGTVDTEDDLISFRVPKAGVGDPTEGDNLTQVYVTTHLPGSQATLDYAPGAKRDSLPESQEDVEEVQPTSLELAVEPKYGAGVYGFSSFEAPEGDLSISLTPSAVEVDAGDQARISVRVLNDADAMDTVTLSVGTTPSGWGANLETTAFDVAAGDDARTFLHVTPPDDAEGQQFIDIEASGTLNDDAAGTVAVTATQPVATGGTGGADGGAATGAQDGSGNGADGSGADGTPQAGGGGSDAAQAGEEESKDSPMIGPVALLASVLGAAFWVKRRKD